MIEECTIENKKEWLSLRMALWPDTSKEDHISEMNLFLSKPEKFAQYLIREPAGKAIGFVEVSIRSDHVNGTHSSPVAFLEGIYVNPKYRRQGIAKKLVEKIIKWAIEKDLKEIASDALLDNVTSHAMHEALGFEETEKVIYYRMDLV